MFMDTTQYMQETGVEKSVAEAAVANASYTRQVIERKTRPQKDQAINCPRCHSTNTKFCYYNNYSLTQPRYFCKACRRYWTEGGTLRNVPVGGGSRKNKRSSISISRSLTISTTSSNPLQSHKHSDLNPPNPKMNHDHPFSSDQNPKIHHDHQGQDLNLGYPTPHDFHHHSGIPQFFEFPKIVETRDVMNTSSSLNSSSTSAPSLSALNLLRTGIGLNSFIPMAPGSLDQTNAIFASSFPFNQECKPALGFSFDGVNGSRLYANPNVSQENNTNGNPFGSTKQHQNESDLGKLGQENSNGYWNGMLGGGSW